MTHDTNSRGRGTFELPMDTFSPSRAVIEKYRSNAPVKIKSPSDWSHAISERASHCPLAAVSDVLKTGKRKYNSSGFYPREVAWHKREVERLSLSLDMSLNTAISVGMSGVSPRWNVKNGSAECQQRDRVSVYTGISRGGASVNTIITVIASWHVQTRDTGITLCCVTHPMISTLTTFITTPWRERGDPQDRVRDCLFIQAPSI